MEAIEKIGHLSEKSLSFSLRENYHNRSFKNGFNSHVNALFTYEMELSKHPELFLNENYKFSKSRYFEAETSFLEALDDLDNPLIESALSNLEDRLYEKIERELGMYYDNNEELGLIIDNTIHNIVLSVRYEFFTRKDEFLNPWTETANILKYDNYLFKAIFDEEEFSEIKKLKKSSNKSEVLDNSEIYVAVKAKSKNLTFGSFKDFVRLRKVMFDLIDELVGGANKPVKFEEIVSRFNKMNSGLSESEIKSKLIYPLKSFSKIGSCKEGYFILRSCEDIAKSYASHYSRMRGFMRTLEAHRLAALRTPGDCYDFDKHRNI